MTARPLPEAVERRLQAALLDAYNHGWAVGARVKAPVGPDNHEAALRAAIARALGGDGEPVAWAVFKGDSYEWVHDDEAKARENERDGYRVVPLYARPAATGDTTDDACPHHSETGLGGCGRFAWHCDGCGRIRWIYDASKGIGSRADVPRGVVLEGPPTTAVEIARRMLTLGDVALLLERAGSSDDEQGSARRTLLRLEALRNALAAEATRAATGGPDAR